MGENRQTGKVITINSNGSFGTQTLTHANFPCSSQVRWKARPGLPKQKLL